MSAGAEVEIVHDFRAIYHLSWWDQVENGDVDETRMLVHALNSRPDSMWRATCYTQNPPAAGNPAKSLGWYEWGPHSSLLLSLRNLVASAVKAPLLSGPPVADANELPPEIAAHLPAGPDTPDGMSPELAALVRATQAHNPEGR